MAAYEAALEVMLNKEKIGVFSVREVMLAEEVLRLTAENKELTFQSNKLWKGGFDG